MTTRDFSDRPGAAFVAGGSGGLGAAIVRLLAIRGSDVAFTYRSNEAAAGKLVDQLSQLGIRAQALQLDLTDKAATAAALERAAATFGGIHTVVYAVGPDFEMRYLSGVTPEEFHECVNNDVIAFYNLVHPALDKLRESKGSVVALGTTATTRAILRDGLSSAPKGAVHAVVKQIALEEGRFGVRANAVGIGMTNAGLATRLIERGDLGENALAMTTAGTPLRRFGTAEDIANAACFLASDQAAFISGQVLNVDGGYSV